MKCKHCQTNNKKDAIYCANCGTKLERKGYKKLSFIIAFVLVVAVAIAAFFIFKPVNKEKEYNEVIDSARKYVEEKEYIKAEDKYLEAIDIEPKEATAYIELADVYVIEDEVEKATQLLNQALDVVYEKQQEKIEDKIEEINNRVSIDQYYDFLLAVYQDPDSYIDQRGGINGTIDTSFFEQNQFGIGDIDEDGVDEIIINFTTTAMAGMHMEVWEYNSDNNTFEMINTLGANSKFYQDGMVKSPLSHNQSAGTSLWPYIIYQYDQDKNEYETIANAYCYDRDYGYVPELDKDNDGIIYYLYKIDETEKPLTLKEYEQEVDKYIPESKLIDLNMRDFTMDNIEGLMEND
ncbi:MAG: hypothetical protein ACLRT4_10700 [Thomasclavelia sp.]